MNIKGIVPDLDEGRLVPRDQPQGVPRLDPPGCTTCPTSRPEHSDIATGGVGEDDDWTLTIARTELGERSSNGSIKDGVIEAKPAQTDETTMPSLRLLSIVSRRRWPKDADPLRRSACHRPGAAATTAEAEGSRSATSRAGRPGLTSGSRSAVYWAAPLRPRPDRRSSPAGVRRRSRPVGHCVVVEFVQKTLLVEFGVRERLRLDDVLCDTLGSGVGRTRSEREQPDDRNGEGATRAPIVGSSPTEDTGAVHRCIRFHRASRLLPGCVDAAERRPARSSI